MKELRFAIILILISLAGISAGCKQAATSTNSDAGTASSNASQPAGTASANNNQPADNTNQSSESDAMGSTLSRLIGSFEMSEVEDKGVVNMLSNTNVTITFEPDGNYVRVSKKDGETYHSDTGKFRLEGNDKLELTIRASYKKGDNQTPTVHKTPIVRAHAFTLSADGQELRMTSDDGRVGVFRRVKSS